MLKTNEIRIISIIISTYNRCERLKNTLDSILNQNCDSGFDYEIIVADNNSRDQTRQIVDLYKPKFNGRLKYVFEPRQGKSYALSKGVAQAQGEIIALTDDDCITDSSWLKSIHRVFVNKNIDLLGGKILPLFNTKKPRWLDLEQMGGPVVYRNLGDKYFESNSKTIKVSGANMCIRRKSYETFGGFTHPFRGQDAELCYRWTKLGAKIAYDPNVIVYHYTDPKRLNKIYFRKWFFLLGKHKAIFLLDDYSKGRLFLNVPFWKYKELLSNIRIFLKGLFLLDGNNFSREIWIWYDLGMICGFNGSEKILEDIR